MTERRAGRTTYGARFLREYRSLVSSTGNLSYAQVQRLKAADRAGFLRLLPKFSMGGVDYATLQRLERATTPEESARILHQRVMYCQAHQPGVFRLHPVFPWSIYF